MKEKKALPFHQRHFFFWQCNCVKGSGWAAHWRASVSFVWVGALWQQGNAAFVFATTEYVEPGKAERHPCKLWQSNILGSTAYFALMNHFLIFLTHIYWSFISEWVAAGYSGYAGLEQKFLGVKISSGFGSAFTDPTHTENKQKTGSFWYALWSQQWKHP